MHRPVVEPPVVFCGRHRGGNAAQRALHQHPVLRVGLQQRSRGRAEGQPRPRLARRCERHDLDDARVRSRDRSRDQLHGHTARHFVERQLHVGQEVAGCVRAGGEALGNVVDGERPFGGAFGLVDVGHQHQVALFAAVHQVVGVVAEAGVRQRRRQAVVGRGDRAAVERQRVAPHRDALGRRHVGRHHRVVEHQVRGAAAARIGRRLIAQVRLGAEVEPDRRGAAGGVDVHRLGERGPHLDGLALPVGLVGPRVGDDLHRLHRRLGGHRNASQLELVRAGGAQEKRTGAARVPVIGLVADAPTGKSALTQIIGSADMGEVLSRTALRLHHHPVPRVGLQHRSRRHGEPVDASRIARRTSQTDEPGGDCPTLREPHLHGARSAREIQLDKLEEVAGLVRAGREVLRHIEIVQVGLGGAGRFLMVGHQGGDGRVGAVHFVVGVVGETGVGQLCGVGVGDGGDGAAVERQRVGHHRHARVLGAVGANHPVLEQQLVAAAARPVGGGPLPRVRRGVEVDLERRPAAGEVDVHRLGERELHLDRLARAVDAVRARERDDLRRLHHRLSGHRIAVDLNGSDGGRHCGP